MGLKGNCLGTDRKQATLINDEKQTEGFFTFHDQCGLDGL